MKSGGVFFLRGRPASVRLTSPSVDSVPGWIFSLGERTSTRGVHMFCAIWCGPEADRFVAANPNLRAGDCLSLELDRLYATGNELRGHITRCELAPKRWPEPPHTDHPTKGGSPVSSTTGAAHAHH